MNSFDLLKFLIAPRRSQEEEARCNVYVRWPSSDRSLNRAREGERSLERLRAFTCSMSNGLRVVRLTCKGYALLLDLLRQLPVNLANSLLAPLFSFFSFPFFFFSKRNFPRDFLRLSRTKRVHRRRDAIFTHSKDFFFFFWPLMRVVSRHVRAR